jgi:hypothetical protein
MFGDASIRRVLGRDMELFLIESSSECLCAIIKWAGSPSLRSSSQHAIELKLFRTFSILGTIRPVLSDLFKVEIEK